MGIFDRFRKKKEWDDLKLVDIKIAYAEYLAAMGLVEGNFEKGEDKFFYIGILKKDEFVGLLDKTKQFLLSGQIHCTYIAEFASEVKDF